MAMSRRKFVQMSSLTAATVPLLGVSGILAQTPAQRISLSAFSSNAALVAALRRGVQVMKARSPSDPKSWFYQAAVHWVSQPLFDEAVARDPSVLQVLEDGRFWLKCPHQGPFYDFPLWHRAYLWHFERILADAAGEPSLRIPYWAYDDQSERMFPQIFAEPLPEPGDSPGSLEPFARNSLFDSRRDEGFMNGLYLLSDAAAGTSAYSNERTFFGTDAQPAFGGSATAPGWFERQPHGTIHTSVGGSVGQQALPIQSTSGLMAGVDTAAFDPIFWVHHCNVERLWRNWECQPNVEWGEFPADWLDTRPWYFQDVDGTVHNHTRRFYLDNENLGVSFDTDDPTCATLSTRLPMVLAGEPDAAVTSEAIDSIEGSRDVVAAASTLSAAGLLLEVGRLAEVPNLSAEREVIVSVPVTSPIEPSENATMSVDNPALFNALFGRTILVLDEIVINDAPSVRYDVHINPAGDPSTASFVGSIDVFRLSMGRGASIDNKHGDHASIVAQQEFDITDRTGGELNDIQVVIVPVSLYEALPGRTVPIRSGDVSIGSIKIKLAP